VKSFKIFGGLLLSLHLEKVGVGNGKSRSQLASCFEMMAEIIGKYRYQWLGNFASING